MHVGRGYLSPYTDFGEGREGEGCPARFVAETLGRLRRPKAFRTLALIAVATSVLGVWGAHGRGPRTPGWTHEDFARAFRHAGTAIRTHQAREGYWMTLYTARPVFERSTPEVNVFVPALMVDLLEPVARETDLGDVLERARAYLRDQIEGTGLARYHGRPGQASPGRLGCEITPDADDTALVWRLAPNADKALLHSALRVLERYRTSEGLYRTWLAPPEAYQCLDPGRDPNPTDVGIQLHLYLFFMKYDLGAARRLCEALQRRISEDRLWVYYELAPLVPLLREGDVSRAGCPVRVPRRRLQHLPAGQDAYLTLSQLLLTPAASSLQSSVLQALRALADGTFRSLEAHPPLLYHNDRSASTPRFYWSQDVGYALWLRTYVEATRRWTTNSPPPGWSLKTPSPAFREEP